MSTTTATDLLGRAHRITRHLRDSREPVTSTQWESFDVALHRALHEIVGADAAYVTRDDPQYLPLMSGIRAYPAPLRPPADIPLTPIQAARLLNITQQALHRQIQRGNLRVVRDGDVISINARDLDQRPDITPADPTDPHPLARLAVTLGAFADLMHHARATGAPVLNRPGEAATTARHVLALGLVAAGHAIGHGPYAGADRPLAVAQYAERVLDTLADAHVTPTSLDRLRSVAPLAGSGDLNDRLEAATYAWSVAAHAETARRVPSTDFLRGLANQSVQLYAVTHQVLSANDPGRLDPDDQASAALVEAARATKATDPLWAPLTTMARPSLEYAESSRALFAVLNEITERIAQPDHGQLDTARVLADLTAAVHTVADVMGVTHYLPERLAQSELLHTPKADARNTLEELTTRRRMHTRVVTAAELADLPTQWRLASVAAGKAVVQLDAALARQPRRIDAVVPVLNHTI